MGAKMLFILDQQKQISQLSQDLKSFGLNPSEWSVLKENSRRYLIRSKEDENFIFMGKAGRQGKQLKWKKLELASL